MLIVIFILLLILLGVCGAIYYLHGNLHTAMLSLETEVARLRLVLKGYKPASVTKLKPTVPPPKSAA